LSQQRRENAALESRLGAALPGVALRDGVLSMRAGLSSAQQRMAARVSPNVRWDSALELLARATPERVRLSDVRMSVEGGRAVCRIVGETPLETSNETLKAYLDALAGAPLVRDCRMGATQRAEGGGGSVQQFEMNLVLVDLPGGAMKAPRVAGVMEGGHD
jgi:Tfp pilus assembly protein PilN